jgi:hypothetical protein
MNVAILPAGFPPRQRFFDDFARITKVSAENNAIFSILETISDNFHRSRANICSFLSGKNPAFLLDARIHVKLAKRSWYKDKYYLFKSALNS